MPADDQHSRQGPSTDSAVMLAALGILAYAASMLTHEALGHGACCLAAGGHNTMLTAWGERCDFVGTLGSALKAAGPGVQFTAGLLAWGLLHRVPPHATRLRFFLWLFMALSLFIASGYVAFSGVTGIGDAADLIAGRTPPIAWRAGLVLLGSTLYYLSMRAAAFELRRIAGPAAPVPRLFRLVGIPYVAIGIFACTAGALNHTMGPQVALGFAAASSFGSASGLFGLPGLPGLPEMQRPLPAPTSSLPTTLTWSTAWAAAAALVVALFVFVIGPGLQ